MKAIPIIIEVLAVAVACSAGLMTGHLANRGDWFGAGLMVGAIAAITHLIATEK